jgi:hypothetical protein
MAEEILRLDRDRAALLCMGRAARAAYERLYTLDRMAEGLEACYRKAFANSAEGSTS